MGQYVVFAFLLRDPESTKSPVRIEHYKMLNLDIVIEKRSTLSPLEEIPFKMSNVISPYVTNIGSLQNVNPDQRIKILKAQVTHVSDVKNIVTLHHGKQLRDPTGTTKLVLWEQHVNSLAVDKTYIFEHLKCSKI